MCEILMFYMEKWTEDHLMNYNYKNFNGASN